MATPSITLSNQKDTNHPLTQSQSHNFNQKQVNIQLDVQRGTNSIETAKNSVQLNSSRDNFFSSLYNKAKVFSNHKQQLKQKEEEKELKECFFSPKINRNPSENSKRTLDNFLSDQKKFENMKKNKQTQLKELVSQEETKELTLKPKINGTKGQIGRDATVPIHERLYNLKDQKQSMNKLNDMTSLGSENNFSKSLKTIQGSLSQTNASISLEESGMFSPRINSKSRSLKRKDHISVILYNDAQRRNQQTKTSCSQERSSSVYSRKGDSLTSVQLNERSEQVYTNSFIKLYYNSWNSVYHQSDSTEQNSTQRVDYLKMNLILELLLFITPSSQITNSQKITTPNLAKERSLVYDIWGNLKGDKFKGISKRNLGLFLLSLQGIKNPLSYDVLSQAYPGSCKNDYNNKQESSTFNFESAIDILENPQPKQRTLVGSNDRKISQISIANLGSEQNSVITNRITNLEENTTLTNLNKPLSEDQKFNETIRQLAEKVKNEQFEQKKVHGYFEGENWFVGDDQFSMQIKYDLLIKNRLNQQHIGNLSQRLIKEQQKENQPKKKNPTYLSGKIISIDLKKPKTPTHHVELLVKQRNMQMKKHEQMKNSEKDKELEGCTFQPNIERNKEKMNNSSLGMEVSLNLYKTMFKTSSQKRDKLTYDVEYEKQCDECTFTPDISHTRNFNSAQRKSHQQSTQLIHSRDFESSIERMKQGRKLAEGQNLMFQRGYHDLPNYQMLSYVSNSSDKQKQSFFSTSQAFRTFD